MFCFEKNKLFQLRAFFLSQADLQRASPILLTTLWKHSTLLLPITPEDLPARAPHSHHRRERSACDPSDAICHIQALFSSPFCAPAEEPTSPPGVKSNSVARTKPE